MKNGQQRYDESIFPRIDRFPFMQTSISQIQIIVRSIFTRIDLVGQESEKESIRLRLYRDSRRILDKYGNLTYRFRSKYAKKHLLGRTLTVVIGNCKKVYSRVIFASGI